MTNAEFARRVGCDPSMASYLRWGRRLPGTDLFLTIVTEFELDANDAGRAYMDGMEAYGAWLRANVFGNGPEEAEPGRNPYEPEE